MVKLCQKKEKEKRQKRLKNIENEGGWMWMRIFQWIKKRENHFFSPETKGMQKKVHCFPNWEEGIIIKYIHLNKNRINTSPFSIHFIHQISFTSFFII